MERIKFVEYKGKNILVEDFSNLPANQDLLSTMEKAAKVIRSSPPKSVLAVFDATDAQFNNAVLSAMKEFTKANEPYIKCSVVVGITGLLNLALSTISKFSGREFKSFKTREDAMDYLIQQ